MEVAGLSLPFGWSVTEFGERFCAASVLLVTLAWSIRTTIKDVNWARKTSTEEEIKKAGYSRPKRQLKKQKTAQKHIDKYNYYGADWEEAVRARRVRMIFSGIILPALLFLIFLGSYSWFLPDRCVTAAEPCALPLGDGLLIVAVNLASDIPGIISLVTSTNIDPWSTLPDYGHLRDDKIFGLAALVARYYTYTVVVAAIGIQWTIYRFWKSIQNEIETLEKVGAPATAAAASMLGSTDENVVVRPDLMPQAAE